MRLRAITLLVALVCASGASMAQKGYQLRNDVNYQEGVIRIKFQEHQAAALDALMKGQRTVQSRAGVLETGFAAVDAVNATIGATEMKRVFRPAGKFEARHRQWGLHLWYEVTYTSDQQLQEVLNAYAGASELAIVEPKEEYSLVDSYNPMAERSAAVANYDVEVIPGGTPNDPSYGQQWGWPAINAAQAWELETGHTSVVVAIEDQGVDYNHPDLNGNMWTNTGETPGNGVDDDGNGYVDDYYGYNFGNDNGNIAIDYHGTHVGGTVAAETNNGVGVAGAAGGSGSNDGVRLMTLSVFGSGAQAGFDEAFIYAADMGAAISQNSWGGGSQSSALENAIDYFRANGGGGVMDGGLVVFAAGNSNSSSTSVGYPASYAPCLAVASIASNLVRSSFSNYGSWVDISAPGSAIYSTYPVSQGSYNSISGTSMACPHVSGVAALVVSNKVRNGESITDEQLWDLLVDNADPSLYNTNGSFSGQLGSGMLDAYASLTGTPPPPPVCYGGGSVISSFPYAESFESGTGAWQQTTCDDIDWTRDASGTPSRNTGPSSGSAGSYYMYVEASSPNYPDKTSNLYANVDLTGSSSATLGFDYHSYGTAADVTLALQVSTNGGTSFSTAWSMTGNQGNQWNSISVDLSTYAGSEIIVQFAAETGSTWQGDVAIDNLSLSTSGSGGGGSDCDGSAPTGYCAADGGSTQYEWIDLIAISGTSINNTTGSNSGYGDFTSQVGNVVTGSTYTISMSAGFSGSTYSENWLFYADWNRDGDFADAGEELGGGTTTNGNTYTTDFTVPSGASLGDTRFRAVMRWNTAAVECGNSSYGEVEDYTLNVCDANTTQVLYEEVHGEALEITQINDRLQLYPNPTTEILNVQIERMPADAVISISDMLGRRVESLTMSEAQNGINVSGLQSGMYIIRIQGTEESFSQSFRKE